MEAHASSEPAAPSVGASIWWLGAAIPFGFGTWGTFLYLGVRFRVREWLRVAVAYLAVIVAAMAANVAANDQGAGSTVAGSLMLSIWLCGGLHAALIRHRVAEAFATGYRTQAQRGDADSVRMDAPAGKVTGLGLVEAFLIIAALSLLLAAILVGGDRTGTYLIGAGLFSVPLALGVYRRQTARFEQQGPPGSNEDSRETTRIQSDPAAPFVEAFGVVLALLLVVFGLLVQGPAGFTCALVFGALLVRWAYVRFRA